MKKKCLLVMYIIIISLIIFCTFTNFSFASDPVLVSTLTSAFTKLKGYIVKIATSFVTVAIATGLLMRKLSLGDEKKIYMANNIIKGSIISYVLLLCIDGILSLINTVIGT